MREQPKWRMNLAVLLAWVIGVMWTVLPTIACLREHWGILDSGAIIFIGMGLFISILSIPAGYTK